MTDMGRRCFITATCFAFSLAILSAQTKQANLRIGGLWMDQYPLVKLTVECLPSAGSDQACETPQDLFLSDDNGNRYTATETKVLSQTDIGTALVLALDASGSMQGRPMLAIRKSLGRFAGRSRNIDRVAIVSFADDVRNDSPFGTDKSLWPSSLEKLATRCCQTHLYDALSESLRLLQAPDLPPVRRVLVISDGKDEGSKSTSTDVIQRATASHIPVDSIGVSRIQAVYLDSLKQIAAGSGGVFSRAQSDADLERLIELGIGQTMWAQVLTFRISHLPADGGVHVMRVSSAAASWQQDRPLQVPKPQAAPAPASATEPLSPILIAGGVIALLAVGLVIVLLIRGRKKTIEQVEQDYVPAAAPTASSPELEAEPPDVRDPATPVTKPARRPSRKTVMLQHFAAPQINAPAAWLRQTAGDGEHFSYALIKTRTWIGADRSATISLPESSGALPMHACVEFEDGQFYISSERPEAHVSLGYETFSKSRRIVQPNDQFSIGNATFLMQLTRPEES